MALLAITETENEVLFLPSTEMEANIKEGC